MRSRYRHLAMSAFAVALALAMATPVLAAPRFTETALRNGSSPSASVATRGSGVRLLTAYYTQRDGSIYADSNCGIAAIAMSMAAFGHVEPLLPLRESVNALTGDWHPDSGLDWSSLIAALQLRGFVADGPYAGGSYRSWTVEEMLAETRAGRPVIALVHQRSLPGHADIDYDGDHYVVFLGATDDGRVVYHDSALPGGEGAYRTTDRTTFEYAWSHTWIGQNNTAMAVYQP
ncbi:MAG TPA: C39 family peptidase [Thermomicrobiales bacterium]|nr:C39 family peptidase [Thermomicrobiales bacterium]